MQELHLSQIDLNLLVGLDTLLRERSVTQAAKRLGLSQSAMSHQLRRLREMFDDPLLVGGRGGMVTTPLAETLEGPVRRALLDLGRAIRGELSFDPVTAERSFTVATKDAVEILGLPPLLKMLAEEAPGIRVRGTPLGPSTLTALQEGDVDLAIGPDLEEKLGMRVPGLRRRVLSRSGWVCVLRRGHPLLARAQPPVALTLEQFLALRHVHVRPPGGDAESSVIDELLAAQGHTRDVVARVSHFISALFAVASSELVATLARSIAQDIAPMLGLQLLEPPLPLPDTALVMTWHERFDEDPANKWLRAAMVRVTDAMEGDDCHGPDLRHAAADTAAQ